MVHLASTGPSLGTETEPTPPALGHNHTNQNGTLSQYWPESGYETEPTPPALATITPTKMVHLASTGPSLGTETEPTPPALGHNHTNQNGTLSQYWPESGYWNWANTTGIEPQSHQPKWYT